MNITRLKIHNFRSIIEQEIFVQKFSLFIGANNAGKSTIMNAIRLFYSDFNWSIEDFPKTGAHDEEVWIEIEFNLSDIEWESLADNYKDNESNTLILRRFFKSKEIKVEKNQSNLYAIINGQLSEGCFYGASNVGLNKLGYLLYIPAITSVSDQTKMSGPSPLRNMINHLLKKVVMTSTSYQAVSDAFSLLGSEAKDENGFLSQISNPINTALKSWDISLDLSLAPIQPEDISKSLIKHTFLDSTLGDEGVHIDNYGHGFQRSVIYELISLATKFKDEKKSAKKEFSPTFNLILFEEPEAFLHPNQQENMAYQLRTLSKLSDHQVFITSHSPNFLDKAHENLLEIIRVKRDFGITCIHQPTQEILECLFGKGIQFINLLQHMVDEKGDAAGGAKDLLPKEEINEADLKCIEAFRYQLWLDSERLSLFFSDTVILTEGATEKVFFNYQLARDWGNLREHKICVVDVNGKYNFHRYMKLLEAFGINHIVIVDGDSNQGMHKQLNRFITSCVNPFTVSKPYFFEKDFEDFLGYKSLVRQDMKPIKVMQKLEKKEICPTKLEDLHEIVKALLNNSLNEESQKNSLKFF